MIKVRIDRVGVGGVMEGWARAREDDNALALTFVCDGEIVARTIADEFRLDLLNAGVGHGHHAFRTRLLKPEVVFSRLHVLAAGVASGQEMAPELRSLTYRAINAGPVAVEELLFRPRWSAEQLSSHTRCLRLDVNMRLMGPYRFVDVTYNFLLGRWIDDGARGYLDQLASGELSPDSFFCQLARSTECSDRGGELPGPFDADFPYQLAQWMPSVGAASDDF